jgi:GTP-binding protein
MGRSNVGKSTLLNALLGGRAEQGLKAFVPVSRRPGTTCSLDFYGVGCEREPLLVLVDTPGYGYSQGGKASHSAWMQRISGYLRSRRQEGSSAGGALLSRVMLLIDARLGLSALDRELLQQLDASLLPCHVVLTKADSVATAELESTALLTARALSALRMPFPVLNAISARTGEGMAQLKVPLMQTSKVHRRRGGEDLRRHVQELQQ